MVARRGRALLAQAMVASERLGAGPGRVDQVVDDGGRNVVDVQRRVERVA